MLKFILIVALGSGIGALTGHFGKCESGQCPLTANPWRGAVFGALIAAALFFPSTLGQKTPAKDSDSVIHVQSASDFKSKILDSSLPSLIDFYADWCGPCRSLSPTISALADKYNGRANIAKVNIDSNKELAEKYQVQSIPCVLLINGGKESARVLGARPQSEYENILNQCLDDGKETRQ